MFQKKHFEKESSVNKKIFIGLEDLHPELLSLIMLDFLILVTMMTRLGRCPIIHMQSTNIVKVWTAITRMQMYYQAYDPKCFL